MEEWRDIDGYVGLYQVSNLGRVRSLDRIDSMGRLRQGQILKITDNAKGYKKVMLCKDGKHINKYVHRLVAQAFIPNHNNLTEVNHKNEIKSDNRVENLEWTTHRDNMEYGTRKQRQREKISGSQNVGAKKIICVTTGEIFDTVRQGADKYNVYPQNISQSIKRDIHCGKLEDGTKLKWDYYEGEDNNEY